MNTSIEFSASHCWLIKWGLIRGGGKLPFRVQILASNLSPGYQSFQAGSRAQSLSHCKTKNCCCSSFQSFGHWSLLQDAPFLKLAREKYSYTPPTSPGCYPLRQTPCLFSVTEPILIENWKENYLHGSGSQAQFFWFYRAPILLQGTEIHLAKLPCLQNSGLTTAKERVVPIERHSSGAQSRKDLIPRGGSADRCQLSAPSGSAQLQRTAFSGRMTSSFGFLVLNVWHHRVGLWVGIWPHGHILTRTDVCAQGLTRTKLWEVLCILEQWNHSDFILLHLPRPSWAEYSWP